MHLTVRPKENFSLQSGFLFALAITPLLLAGKLLVDVVVDSRPLPSRSLAGDPKIGTSVPLPERDVFGRAITPTAGRTLLIYAGSCSSCSYRADDWLKYQSPDFKQTLLVYSGSKTDLLRSQTPPSRDVFLLADEKRQLLGRLNAVWAPRWYELESRTLIRIQQTESELPK
jgi:hypothetical protein